MKFFVEILSDKTFLIEDLSLRNTKMSAQTLEEMYKKLDILIKDALKRGNE